MAVSVPIQYKARTYKRALPEEWDEVTPRQFRHLLRILHLFRPYSVDFYRHLAYKWLNIPSRVFVKISPEARVELYEVLKFVEEGGPKRQLIPSIWLRGRRYYGPTSNFEDVTIKEWAFVELFLGQIAEGDEEALQNLLGMLYRRRERKPKAPYYFMRAPLVINEQSTSAYQRIGQKMPISVATATLLMAQGVQQHWRNTYRRTFEEAETEEKEKDGRTNWPQVFHGLAGVQMGTITDVENLPAHVVFQKLEAELSKPTKTQ